MNYVDNPKILQTVDHINDLVARIHEDSGPMLKDAREALANLNRVSATVGDPQEQDKIRKTLDRHRAARRARERHRRRRTGDRHRTSRAAREPSARS